MIAGQRAAFSSPTKDIKAVPNVGLLSRIVLVLFIMLPFGIFTPTGEGNDHDGALEQGVWALVYGASVIGLIMERRRAWPLIKNSLPIVAVIALVVVSSFWSDYHDISFKRSLELVGTSAVAYFIVCHFKLLEFLECWSIAVAVAALTSFVYIFGFPGRGLMQEEYPGTWRGIFNHKNALGQAMILGILTIIIVAYARGRQGRSKKVPFFAAALCGILLIGSQSATSYLVFAVLSFILFIYVASNSPRAKRVLPFVAIMSAIILLGLVFNIDTVIGILGRDTTFSGRTDIWEPVMDAIRTRPWLGYGYDTFWLPDGSGSAYMPVLTDWAPGTAHQGLLELMLDMGIVGVATFLFALAVGLSRAWKFMRQERDIVQFWPLLAMIYFISSNVTEANIAKYRGTNWVIFLVAFLFVSVPRVAVAQRGKVR